MAQQLRGKGITLDKVLTPSDPKNRKTKVRSKGEKRGGYRFPSLSSHTPQCTLSHPQLFLFPM
jgi:hypothetical protein